MKSPRNRTLRSIVAPLVVSLALSAAVAAQVRWTEVDISSLSAVVYRDPAPADVKAKRNKPADFPAWVKALNGKSVSIAGYMLPYDTSANQVTEFSLTGNQMGCCFGPPVNVQEWVWVTTRGHRPVDNSTDMVVVRGTFTVGEQFDEAGYVTSIYQMVADAVGEPVPSLLTAPPR